MTYTRDTDGRIASVSATGTAIVSAISYLPFGPTTGYTFADGGQSLDKLYDANYRATDIEGSALNLHFTLDAMGDIKAEGNATGVPTPNETYLYDPLYRLQQVDDATGSPWQTYTYNGTGDRLTKAMAGLGTDSYNYQTGTHRLLSIGGYDVSNRAVDANGNTTAFQANGWTYELGYNDTNRLALVQQNGSTVATYGLNGRGERIVKTLTGGGSQVYAYDEAGHLLGEYATGQSRDYVWADGALVAILDNPAQGGDNIHYVYTDNLGTPRSVTTQAGTLVWDWPYNQNPFGEAAVSGSGYTLNLRYPGQYFDQEDGLNYNYHRDYEPGTGRYVESDPIGLDGGVSTYSYAESNSLRWADASGNQIVVPVWEPRPTLPFIPLPGMSLHDQQLLHQMRGHGYSDEHADDNSECPRNNDCQQIYNTINELLGEIKQRYVEMRVDKYDLYTTRPSGPMSWEGHQQQFRQMQATLRATLEEADFKGCFDYPLSAWSWATKAPPSQPGPK